MAAVTYFVVLAFDETEKGRFVPREPLTPQSADAARRAAQRLATEVMGVVAFSRTGDPDLGNWADAVVLANYGVLPDELSLPAREVWEIEEFG